MYTCQKTYEISIEDKNELLQKLFLKIVSPKFLLVCFVRLKESACETKKNVFLFHFESSFHSSDNQILTF